MLALGGCLVVAAGFGMSLRIFQSLVSPISALLVPWGLAILLLSLDWIDYAPVQAMGWLLMGGALLTAVSGMLATKYLYRPAVNGAVEEDFDVVKGRRFLYAAHAVGFFGFLLYIWSLSRTASLSAILAEPYLGRAAQSDDDFKGAFQVARNLNYMNIVNCMLGYYLRLRVGHWPRGLRILSLVSACTVLFSFERTTPFMLIIWFVMTRMLMTPRKDVSVVRMVGVSAVTGLALLGLFVWIGNLVGKTFENNVALQTCWRGPEWATELGVGYLYLTGNLPAFQAYIGSFQPGETSGMLTLAPLVKTLSFVFGAALRVPEEVREFMLIPLPFNTSTYLNLYWSDFGIPGVLLCPLVLGVLATLVYVNARATRRVGAVTLAGLFLYGLLHSIFVNKFVSTPLWQYALCIVIFHFLCERRRAVPAVPVEGARATG